MFFESFGVRRARSQLSLCTTCSPTSYQNREHIRCLFFLKRQCDRTLGVPAMYVSMQAVLSLYATGKTSRGAGLAIKF